MYITGKNRYVNYTSRYDVYLFTLRDYTEMLLDKFGGRYIDRSDMPIHSGYLLRFIDIDAATAFITGIATSSTTEGDITTYVLPHLEGNELPLYATIKDSISTMYIGLSEYKEALDNVDDSLDIIVVPYVQAVAPDKDFWGTLASEIQTDISVVGKTITGSLTKLTSGQLVTDWGEGYFIGLKFIGDWDKLTSVQVGMNPSQGSGLVEIINDPDKDGVFKVTDKTTQRFMVVATDGINEKTVAYDLSGLTLVE